MEEKSAETLAQELTQKIESLKQHEVSTFGYYIMAGSMVFFFVNIIYSLAAGKKAAANPWGEGATTLEWTLPSPPPYHQFETLPVITDAHDYHDHRPATA